MNNKDFDNKPIFIKNWDDLEKVKDISKTHYIEIDEEGLYKSFYVYSKTKGEEDNLGYGLYLHTHTFYGLNFIQSTKDLQERGFNVILDNWDKNETRIVETEKSKDERINKILEELCKQYPNNILIDERPKTCTEAIEMFQPSPLKSVNIKKKKNNTSSRWYDRFNKRR